MFTNVRPQKFSRVLYFVFSVMLMLCWQMASAQDEASEGAATEEGEAAVSAEQAIYLPLKPPFIVNYGSAGRLRYIKAEMSVRLSNVNAAQTVRYHMPFVRNNIIQLLAAQTNESVGSQVGKEKIRSDILEEIRTLMEKEGQLAREEVVDVYFNNFIVQK